MSSVKCIVIEDDPAFQTIYKTLIKKLPQLDLLDVFDNSVDAALFITRKRPDLVFLDVEINGLNGLEVFDTLEHKPKTIVISSDNKYEEEANDLKVDAFIQKPIKSFDHFKETVESVLSK